MAPRIQHIALAVEDPAKTAAYYKEVFDMKELNRSDHGVWLTDGYFYFAILPCGQAATPLEGGVGIQHIGFAVDDLEDRCALIEAEGAKPTPDSTESNRKYQDADGMCVDIRSTQEGFWDHRVGSVTQLYNLVPAV